MRLSRLALLVSVGFTLEAVADWRDDYETGRKAFNQKRWEEAITSLEKASREMDPRPAKTLWIEGFSETYMPYYHLALARLGLGQCDAAREATANALAHGPLIENKREHGKLRRKLAETCPEEGDAGIAARAAVARARRAFERFADRDAALLQLLADPRRSVASEVRLEIENRRRHWVGAIEAAREGLDVAGEEPALVRIHRSGDLAAWAADRLQDLIWEIDAPGDGQRELSEGVVKIVAWHGGNARIGTGIIVGRGATTVDVVTATHVISQGRQLADTITVYFPADPEQRRSAEARYWEDGPNGLAALRITDAKLPLTRCLPFRTTEMNRLDEVFLLGFPPASTERSTLTQGTVVSLDSGRIAVEATSGEGNSGGPLIAKKGTYERWLAGVVTSAGGGFVRARPAADLHCLLISFHVDPCKSWPPPSCENRLAIVAYPDYQDRGDRFEGVREQPIAGDLIQLLSATIEGAAFGAGWPPTLRVRFHLAEKTRAYVSIRELLPRGDPYWLDGVDPDRWRPGYGNVFEWPTDVLQDLETVRIDDLGVVVRLGEKVPGRSEEVAPAILYHGHSPAVAEAYLFTFKTNDTVEVEARIFRGESREPIQERIVDSFAGKPFTVRWPCAEEAEGDYRLVLRAPRQPAIHKEIRFLHVRRVGAGS